MTTTEERASAEAAAEPNTSHVSRRRRTPGFHAPKAGAAADRCCLR